MCVLTFVRKFSLRSLRTHITDIDIDIGHRNRTSPLARRPVL